MSIVEYIYKIVLYIKKRRTYIDGKVASIIRFIFEIINYPVFLVRVTISMLVYIKIDTIFKEKNKVYEEWYTPSSDNVFRIFTDMILTQMILVICCSPGSSVYIGDGILSTVIQYVMIVNFIVSMIMSSGIYNNKNGLDDEFDLISIILLIINFLFFSVCYLTPYMN